MKIPLLRDLQLAEAEEARRLVAESKGNVLVLVHPHFHEGDNILQLKVNSSPSCEYRFNSMLYPYLSRLAKLVSASKPKLVVVFEEKHKQEDTMVRLQSRLGKGRKIVFVPTHRQSVEPVDYDWGSLTSALKRLGAKKLFIGGEYYREVGKTKDFCVGKVFSEMARSGKFEGVHVLPKAVIRPLD